MNAGVGRLKRQLWNGVLVLGFCEEGSAVSPARAGAGVISRGAPFSDGTTRQERMIKKGVKLRKVSEGFNFFLRLSFNAQRVQFQTSRLLKASGAVENYLTFAA